MDITQNVTKFIKRWNFLLIAVFVIHGAGPCSGRILINNLCKSDNETVSPETIFTRAAARAHSDNLGVSVPSSLYRSTLRKASAAIQYRGEDRKWVMVTMADKKVAEKVLPLTLQALWRLPLEQGLESINANLLLRQGSPGGDEAGGDVDVGSSSLDALVPLGPGASSGRNMSSLLVVVTWDADGQKACVELQEQGFDHKCVQDHLHELHEVGSTKMAAFHSPEFNALGFAKIKYLYNALSLGYDVMAMDADVLVLQSPFPFVLQQRAQLAALTERCEVVDPSMQLQLGKARHPNQNIGVMFARADGPVMRCVERWFGSMVAHVDYPRLWDQEEFNKVISSCAPHMGLRWHSLDNRRFVSMCYPQCGCTYPDSERELLTDPVMRRKHFEWSYRRGMPYEDPEKRTCGPSTWSDWVLAHFPCQGSLRDKIVNMGRLMEGYMLGEPRVIKNTEKVP
ncbi:hypothetical protein Vafri_8796 [Volvox africanus]|uniref:Nucleotide-diphospho-sugar transferase domain-containing protein n=1 Tax=Volvox africanus TaxID=51714 RepID=A0A8J4B7C3_9CHLO|nr:hypothetical protein Vafri_8796 [Volvox africanus]